MSSATTWLVSITAWTRRCLSSSRSHAHRHIGAFIRIKSPSIRNACCSMSASPDPSPVLSSCCRRCPSASPFPKLCPESTTRFRCLLRRAAGAVAARAADFSRASFQRDIYLHPVARAGMGGRVRHRAQSAARRAIGRRPYPLRLDRRKASLDLARFHRAADSCRPLFWQGWLMWAVLLFLFARRHPAIYDLTDFGRARIRLGSSGARHVPAMLHACPHRQQLNILTVHFRGAIIVVCRAAKQPRDR